MKLTIELIPKTSWCSNVRSLVKRSVWDKLRKQICSVGKCQICGASTSQKTISSICSNRLECHEVWAYDDKTHVQTLTGLVALANAAIR